MKICRCIIPLFLLIGLTVSCVQPPADIPNAEVQTFDLLPVNDDHYSIFAIKSHYNSYYESEDSLIFVHIDTSGNMIEQYAMGVPFRPNIRLQYLMPNGNVLLYGNLDLSYYTAGLWEIDNNARLQRELQLDHYSSAVIPSLDGNIILFGSSYTEDDIERLPYIKGDLSGDTIWVKELPVHYRHSISAGIPLSDNGFLALGNVRTENGDTDMFAARADADGDTLWTGTYGGENYDKLYLAEELSDGSFLMAGELNVTDTTNPDWRLSSGQQIYLINVSANGEKEWSRAVGTTLRERPNALLECSDGNYILLGTREESYAYIFDETVGWISKIDRQGNTLWQTEFNSIIPSAVRELPSGVLLISATGLIDNYKYASEMHLIKLSSSGTVLMNKALTP
ncbi:MAG: hypothetical protein U5N56_03525 [Candidatus Marinimicrobia bacterium]|nr:hypothetical protein [Candidatus Neomarinimicrobiota bacterium]